jgi:transcriptional regulator with XRE-family HTH domain
LEFRITIRIAERVRALRTAAGLSQEALGARAKLHRTYIGAVERGEKSITVVTLAKLARALSCELSALIPEEADADRAKR